MVTVKFANQTHERCVIEDRSLDPNAAQLLEQRLGTGAKGGATIRRDESGLIVRSIEAKQEGAKQVLTWIDGCQHDEDLALKHWRVLEVGVDEAPGQRREIASVFRKSASVRLADVARQNPANAHIELERPALRM